MFEAAFVIDDSDEPSRTGTPKPNPSEKDTGGDEPNKVDSMNGEKAAEKGETKNDKTGAEADKGSQDDPSKEKQSVDPAAPPATSELPHEIKQRLRKLDKLEATYPGRQLTFHSPA